MLCSKNYNIIPNFQMNYTKYLILLSKCVVGTGPDLPTYYALPIKINLCVVELRMENVSKISSFLA